MKNLLRYKNNDFRSCLKYFYKKNNLLELRPANNDYKSIFVDLEKDDVVLEGLGVGLIRKN